MEDDEDGGIDRISYLCNDVLLNILSFTPARARARTSVLSQRWRHLMSLNQSLYFDAREYQSMASFKDHAERALRNCRAGVFIPRYRVVAPRNMDHESIHQWLNFAKDRNIGDMEFELLSMADHSFGGMVLDVFGHCQSLQRLKLVMQNWRLDFDGAVGLRNLKFLHLIGVRPSAGMSMLVSGSHFLEELHLQDCLFEKLIISAHELKRLNIIACVFTDHKVEICTPKLLNFRYACEGTERCRVQDMSSLMSASISISNSSWFRQSEKPQIAKEIVEGLWNAKSIAFTYLGAEHISVDEHWSLLPQYCKMKSLRLNITINSNHMKAISCMLKFMPNLEKLVVYNERVRLRSESNEKIRWITRVVTHGRLNCINEIELGNFESHKQEIEFIDFLFVMGRLRHPLSK